MLDGRTLQSSCECGPRAGYDGHKRKKGSKVHRAVDTLGYLLAVHLTPANQQQRAQVQVLEPAVQQATAQTVKLAFAVQGYTAQAGGQAAQQKGLQLRVVKLPKAKKGGCCCRADGWSNPASDGWLAFDALFAIMNVCLKSWPRFIPLSLPS